MRPTFNYGGPCTSRAIGSNHIRYAGGADTLRLTTDAALSYIAHETPFALIKPVTLILGPDEPFEAAVDTASREFLERTRDYWLDWVRSLAIPLEFQTEVIRAAITLKLCNFEETGAIIAAHTTSIPEAPGHRSATGTIATAGCGTPSSSSRRSIAWARRRPWKSTSTTSPTSRVDAERPLRPVYGIVPTEPLEERIAPDLAGFGAAAPCGSATRRPSSCSTTPTAASSSAPRRCSSTSGCRAWATRPCSAASSRWARRRSALRSSPTPGPGSTAAASACTRIPRPCAGSPATGWRASPARLGLADRAAHWRGEAQALRDQILKRAWNERQGALAGALDHDELDASVLLLPELGLLPATDERFVRTCKVIGKELARNGFIMRYTAEDDFGLPETAFLVCQFWYIDALGVARAAARRRRELFATSSRAATASACCRRTSTLRPASCGATCRKPTRWPASSTPAASSRAAGSRPGPRP